MSKKLYEQRDIESLAELYLLHSKAMTDEGLHAKNRIAAELAFRDSQIARLQAIVDKALAINEGAEGSDQ